MAPNKVGRFAVVAKPERTFERVAAGPQLTLTVRDHGGYNARLSNAALAELGDEAMVLLGSADGEFAVIAHPEGDHELAASGSIPGAWVASILGVSEAGLYTLPLARDAKASHPTLVGKLAEMTRRDSKPRAKKGQEAAA